MNCPLPNANRSFSDSSASLWVISEPSVGRMDGRGLAVCLLSASIHFICGREGAAPGTQSETAVSQRERSEMGKPGEEERPSRPGQLPTNMVTVGPLVEDLPSQLLRGELGFRTVGSISYLRKETNSQGSHHGVQFPSVLKIKRENQSRRDFSKALASKAWGPELDPKSPCNCGVWSHDCDLSTGETQKRESLVFAGLTA